MCGDGFRRLLICRLRPVRETTGLEFGIPDSLRRPVLFEFQIRGGERGILLRLREAAEGDRAVLDRVGCSPKLPCQVAGSEFMPTGRLRCLPGLERSAFGDDGLGLDRFDVGEDLLLPLLEYVDLVLDLFGRLAGEIRCFPERGVILFLRVFRVVCARDQREEHGPEGGNADDGEPDRVRHDRGGESSGCNRGGDRRGLIRAVEGDQLPDRTGERPDTPDHRASCSGEESGSDDDALGAFIQAREPVGKARRTLDRGHQRVGDQVAECDAECLDSALQFAEGSADAALHRLGHPLRGTVTVL